MKHFFSALAVVTIILSILAGLGVFWLAKSDIQQAHTHASKAIAKGYALGISAQLKILQDSVTKMATFSETLAAVNSNDALLMAQTADKLQQLLPGAMKIRILPATIDDLDESSIPFMGNADLLMVKNTLDRPQTAVIQGQAKNRHLAITALIKNNDVPIGVILVSLKFDFLQSSLNQYNISEGSLDLKQGNALLAHAGIAPDKNEGQNPTSLPVANSYWAVHFKTIETTDLSDQNSLFGILLVPPFLICLICFLGYQKFCRNLRRDQASILNIVKDLMTGKKISSYPIVLTEMETIVNNIIQLKRTLSQNEETKEEETDYSAYTDSPQDNSDLLIDDDFFDEPQGVSFLDSSMGFTDITEETQEPFQATDIKELSEDPSLSTETGTSIYRANDIRGIVGKTLTKDIILDIGLAIGSEAKEKNLKNIVLGRDGRLSSPELTTSLAEGILFTGVNILDLGLVPSPVAYFISHHSEDKSSVVVTGSHNPSEYNGIKINLDGDTLAGDQIKQLQTRVENQNFLTGEKGTIEQNNMFVNEYIGTISDDIHIVRPMKVVIDCGNGATGEIAPLLLKTLGCEVIELFCDIDGSFPNHHPDPSKPENLTELIASVRHHNADVGIAFDCDGDSIGVVDSKGKIIWPDRLMMLFAKDVLTSNPGAEILYDVKCTRLLGEQIIKFGGFPLMKRSGHSFMKKEMKKTGAALAGEMNGHIYFNDRWFGFDDGLYAASRLIEILSADTRNSNEVFSDFPDNINTSEIIIQLTEGENIPFIEKIFDLANFDQGKIINTDGLRVDFSDGWGLVRASNTLPALSLRFEANNVDALNRIQSQFKELLLKVDPDITVPF